MLVQAARPIIDVYSYSLHARVRDLGLPCQVNVLCFPNTSKSGDALDEFSLKPVNAGLRDL